MNLFSLIFGAPPGTLLIVNLFKYLYESYTYQSRHSIWFLAGFLAFYLHQATKYRLNNFKAAKIARQHGCQPPRFYPHYLDPIFGLDLKFSKIPFWEYGGTIKMRNWVTYEIRTIDPANLESIHASNSKDWGYSPDILPEMLAIYGPGFMTANGETWKDSREIFQKAFDRTSSDLSLFNKSLDQFLALIPRDGSTVDLQPLLSKLVTTKMK